MFLSKRLVNLRKLSTMTSNNAKSGTLKMDDVGSNAFKHVYEWLNEVIAIGGEMPEKIHVSTVQIEADGTLQPQSRLVLMKNMIFDDKIVNIDSLFKKDESQKVPDVDVSTHFTSDNTSPEILQQLSQVGAIVFGTNYESNKGVQMSENPRVAVNFHWPELERVVRINGTAYRTPESFSDHLHHVRPRPSRVSAVTSQQSRPVASRECLWDRYDHNDALLHDKKYSQIDSYRNTVSDLEDNRAAHNIPRDDEEDYVPRPPYWGGIYIIPHKIEFWQGCQNRFHERIQCEFKDGKWELTYLQP